jgi:hypothetical protein
MAALLAPPVGLDETPFALDRRNAARQDVTTEGVAVAIVFACT